MTKRSIKLKYIKKVPELGPINRVKIAPNNPKQIKKPAINIVIYIVILPKKSEIKPIINKIVPIIIQWFSTTDHKLEIWNTGHPYLEFPIILTTSSSI